ncbi:MAG: MerR family transcriptional regulator [Acidobacteriaceae bacterium]
MAKHAVQRRAHRDPVIPDKLYFRIGDVAKLCGVEAYVLRFWESEFPQLRPNKSGTGQRLYRRRDVELAIRIRSLLHDEGYTIAGARQVLAQESARSKSPQLPLIHGTGNAAVQAKLQRLRNDLRELLGILSAAPAKSPSRKPRASEPRPNLFE